MCSSNEREGSMDEGEPSKGEVREVMSLFINVLV